MPLIVTSGDNERIMNPVLVGWWLFLYFTALSELSRTSDACFLYFDSIYAASLHLDLQWISWHLM